MYQHLYLDLDRTLLDTSRFSDALIAAFEQVYRVPAEKFQAQMPQFYIHRGVMQYYDFYAHISMLGHDPKEVEERVRPIIKNSDYLFPDARELLKVVKDAPIEASVLSYGPENYQHFKWSFLLELHQLPFVATLQFKQDFLADQPAKRSLLVDDKIVEPLPEWCTQFLLDRSAADVHIQESEQLWRINSLKVVETAISVGYNGPNQKRNTDEAD